jgi:DNA primase
MSSERKQEADRRNQLFEINREAAKYYYSLLRSEKGRVAYEYFEKRELSRETMQKFGLGYADKYSNDLYQYLRKKGYTDEILKESGLITIDEQRGGHDKFWNRAMFPIMDANNKVIAFGGRVMGDGEPKYLNSPETAIFNKSRTLYGLHLARRSRQERFILCEGYMDVIALHQAGFDNAIASLGTALTSGHANMIKRYGKDVYLSYDSDGAGTKAALRAIPILKEAGITCKVINMQPYKDPDEFIKGLGAQAYLQRINEAENSFLFTIRILAQDYDMADPESKTAFYQQVAAKILEFPEELERNNYIESVSQHYPVSYESLRQMVNHLGTKVGLTAQAPKPLKSGVQKKRTREDSMMQSQRLLLTWLVERPEIYAKIKDYIGPEDFTEGIYAQVAGELFAQLASGETLNPARIVSLFHEEEQQRQVAEIFNTTVQGMETAADWSKAVKETLLRVKQNSMEQRRKKLDPSDRNSLNQMIEDKRRLQEMERLHISLD